MNQPIDCSNAVDQDGNPAGGYVEGVGIEIYWQRGPLGRGSDRQEPNGAFVETVLEAVKQRLEHYQEGRFACTQNSMALKSIRAALAALEDRTISRECREVEGTHKV